MLYISVCLFECDFSSVTSLPRSGVLDGLPAEIKHYHSVPAQYRQTLADIYILRDLIQKIIPWKTGEGTRQDFLAIHLVVVRWE